MSLDQTGSAGTGPLDSPLISSDADLSAPVRMAERRHLLPVVITGHVDHGKSTFIGRLLNDTGALEVGKAEALREMSRRRGMPFEWSFAIDALQAERDQGITIDTSQARFRTALRDYLVIDAPGHREFLKNMVTGASAARAAILVVDAAEGVSEQSRRHAFLLELLGIRSLIVAVNKLDRVGFAEAAFRAVKTEIEAYLQAIGLAAAAIVPIVARDGDNIATPSERLGWYHGPTVVEALDALPETPETPNRPLRLPVQDIYKFDNRRIIVGRIETGRVAVGDRLSFAPDHRGASRQAQVASIEGWNAAPVTAAWAGQSVGLTLVEDIFVERGDVAFQPSAPPQSARRFEARIFWFGQTALEAGRSYVLKIGMAGHRVEVERVNRVVDLEKLDGGTAEGALAGEGPSGGGSLPDRQHAVGATDIADVVLTSRTAIAFDDAAHGGHLGRGVLVDGYDIVGGAIVRQVLAAALAPVARRNLTLAAHRVSAQQRAAANGHTGGILWLTGLSGAGKTTLAMALEQALVMRRYHTVVLDGDNLRATLNGDLGFSPAERSENVRRIGEVATLLAESGTLAIVACISPLRADRDKVRARAGHLFHEVYVEASVVACEARDVKGLYARARRGEIAQFSGISAPYEPPPIPDLRIDTAATGPERSAADLLAYVDRNFAADRGDLTEAA